MPRRDARRWPRRDEMRGSLWTRPMTTARPRCNKAARTRAPDRARSGRRPNPRASPHTSVAARVPRLRLERRASTRRQAFPKCRLAMTTYSWRDLLCVGLARRALTTTEPAPGRSVPMLNEYRALTAVGRADRYSAAGRGGCHCLEEVAAGWCRAGHLFPGGAVPAHGKG